MIKDCFLISILFWMSFLAVISFGCRNIFILILLKSIIFSLIFHPMFCGIIYGNILKFFNKNYLKCVKNGFIIYLINTFTGIILMIPFVVSYHLCPAKLNLLTAILAGMGATTWLLLLTNIVFCSFWPEKNILKTIIYSAKLCKDYHITIFALILETYLGIILIFPSPWAIKNYICKITNLRTLLTNKLNKQINYSTLKPTYMH